MDTDSGLTERRADLYQALAEALADIPPWMSLPSQEWPLTTTVASLTGRSNAAKHALADLNNIPLESEAARRERHMNLFGGPDRPRFWLYESVWQTGQFLGPEVIALEQLYKLMGLHVVGAEAPDHASIELALLAHLAERQVSEPDLASKWNQLERKFIKKHAGQWLPKLGRSLAASGDAVYGPIGQLMADWILEAQQSHRSQRKTDISFHLPGLSDAQLCSLCGFCVQVCPTSMLRIQETSHETMLQATSSLCTGCRKCENACPSSCLIILASDDAPGLLNESIILKRSSRVRCPGCGQATVSQAELDFVIEQLGQQDWLPYCLQCRSEL